MRRRKKERLDHLQFAYQTHTEANDELFASWLADRKVKILIPDSSFTCNSLDPLGRKEAHRILDGLPDGVWMVNYVTTKCGFYTRNICAR